MKSQANITESPLSENFAKLELVAKGVAVPDLTEDSRALGLFLTRQILIGRGEDIGLADLWRDDMLGRGSVEGLSSEGKNVFMTMAILARF